MIVVMKSRGLGFEFCFLLFLVGLLFKQNGDIRAKCFPGWQHGRETGLNNQESTETEEKAQTAS